MLIRGHEFRIGRRQKPAAIVLSNQTEHAVLLTGKIGVRLASMQQ